MRIHFPIVKLDHAKQEIMRAFVRVREMLGAHRELAARLKELESRIQDHDQQIQAIFEVIRQLMTPPEKPRKKIGFEVSEPKGRYGKGTRKMEG